MTEEVKTETNDTSAANVADLTAKPEYTPAQAKYLEKIRDEAKKWREIAEDLEPRVREFETRAENAERLASDREKDVSQLTEARKHDNAVNTILRNAKDAADEAVLLKVLDPAQFVFDEEGKITNAKELVETLRSESPFLFKPVNTSSNTRMPSPAKLKPVHVSEMTTEEYAAYKRKEYGI